MQKAVASVWSALSFFKIILVESKPKLF